MNPVERDTIHTICTIDELEKGLIFTTKRRGEPPSCALNEQPPLEHSE
jgi:hypothetical protein